jgi:hypothetical protein
MSDILATKHVRQISRLPVPGTALTTVLLAVVVVVALYFGREVLVPIALAVLMSFVLAPPVRRLQDWYVPRILRGATYPPDSRWADCGIGRLVVPASCMWRDRKEELRSGR